MVALFLSLTTIFFGSQNLDPTEIADRVQAVYDKEECISSEFVQIYISGTSGASVEESGKLSLKKPGKMRWEYQNPDAKYYISDGEIVYWYVPADGQVTTLDLDSADQEQAQILFLMGRGDLSRDFKVSFTEEFQKLHPESFLLKFVPEKEQSFDYLVMEINPKDYYVERLMSVDPLGNIMEYRFLNIRQDNIDDRYFTFEIPKGVEVISGNQGDQ